MGVDPRKLRISELARILNSTPLGEVAKQGAFYRHKTQGGFKIGDGKTVDLVRYGAWLYQRRRTRPVTPDLPNTGYEQHKDAANQRSRLISSASRDIAAKGWIHAPKDPERRARAATDLRYFLEAYFMERFTLAWSDDHLEVIHDIEQAVLNGLLQAIAMPRGSGKTSIIECAVIWAMLYAYHEFIAVVGADKESAEEILDSVMVELEYNDRLEADFSEVCGPVRALEGIRQRAGGQLYQGQRTNIEWTADKIVLPTIPSSKASGIVVKVAGITGRIRGMKYTRADGRVTRPSLALVDDPQTDESAASPSQSKRREGTLSGAVLGLAGPGKKIAGLAAVTVIFPDDMADRLLDRKLHPEWQGKRKKLIYTFPTDEKLWEDYSKLRREGQENETGTAAADDFYREHQQKMDAGAVIAWKERKNDDELSAIQHAMNLLIDRGRPAFFAEFQNEPPRAQDEIKTLKREQLRQKANGIHRGLVPSGHSKLTAFIDVQDKCLYWGVISWAEGFTGHIVDYGAWPDQKRSYFTLHEVTQTMAKAKPGSGYEGALLNGLEKLTQQLLGRDWLTETGVAMRIDKCAIDANYQASTEVVRQFCRRSHYSASLIPSHGRYLGASAKPIGDGKRSTHEQVGMFWRLSIIKQQRHMVWDTNYWKSACARSLEKTTGDHGGITFFGRPSDHDMMIDHFCAEYPVRVTARGRAIDEWHTKPGQDEHLWDCLVGSMVAASIIGIAPEGMISGPIRKKVSFAELQRKRRSAS